jgi:hypothetical protein
MKSSLTANEHHQNNSGVFLPSTLLSENYRIAKGVLETYR